MESRKQDPRDYLRIPYARVLTPDDETGTYTAEILEFPGCVAQGNTPEEAYEHLESAASGWIEAALNMGQEIPEPSDPYSYSGRIALRLPRGLHRRAAQMAERDGTSLNQFLVAAIAERVGASTLHMQIAQRLEEQVAQVAAKSAGVIFNSAMGVAARTWPDSSFHFGELSRPLQLKKSPISSAKSGEGWSGVIADGGTFVNMANEPSEAHG
jgi:predicted RNase H-like HicB family nuclease